MTYDREISPLISFRQLNQFLNENKDNDRPLFDSLSSKEKEYKYKLVNKDNLVIDYFYNRVRAEIVKKQFEREDIKQGIFEEGYYKIMEV